MFRYCIVCGKKEDMNTVECSFCGNIFPHAPEPVDIDFNREHEELCFLLSPALEDPDKLAACESKILKYIEKYKEIFSKNAYESIKTGFEDGFKNAKNSWRRHKEYKANEATRALTNMANALNSKSEYKGMGFGVISDAAGVATYAAMDAFKGYVHDVTETAKSLKKANEELKKFSVNSNYSYFCKPVLTVIEKNVSYLKKMTEIKVFVDEHKEFYKKHHNGQLFGVDMNIELEYCGRNNEFVLYLWNRDKKSSYQQLEAAGYIVILFGKYAISTGKYETETLKTEFLKSNPEMAAREKQIEAEYKEQQLQIAENLLQQKEFYQAAVCYARINTPESLKKSLRIWEQNILCFQGIERGYFVRSDGHIEKLFYEPFIRDIDNYYLNGPYCFQKIFFLKNSGFIGLTYDGRIVSSASQIYSLEDQIERNEKVVGGNGSKLSNIVDLSCSSNHLLALHADGHVTALGNNAYGQCDVKEWTDIKEIKADWKSSGAIKNDGTVVLAGAISDYAEECSGWKNIQSIYIDYNSIIGLTSDGRVLAAGRISNKKELFSKWHNVVRICWFYNGIFGITDSGHVLYDNKNETISKICTQMTAIVKIIYSHEESIVALRADGTLFVYGADTDLTGFTDLTEASYLNYMDDLPLITAIKSNGEVLFAGNTLYACRYQNYPENVFENINTYNDCKMRLLEAVHDYKNHELKSTWGLFAAKKKKSIQDFIDFIETEIEKIRKASE